VQKADLKLSRLKKRQYNCIGVILNDPLSNCRRRVMEFAVSVALAHGFGAYTTGVFQDLLFRLESEAPGRSSGWD